MVSCSTAKDVNYGYDAQKGEFTDLVQTGMIDRTKVVRHALQDAASVAGLLVNRGDGDGEAGAQAGDAARRRHGRHGFLTRSNLWEGAPARGERWAGVFL